MNPNWKGGISSDHYRYTAKFRAKSPEKARVQSLVARAIQRGALVRPSACSQCAATCVPHAHHDDYRQPLAVRWLCRSCHLAHHAELRREATAKLRRSA